MNNVKSTEAVNVLNKINPSCNRNEWIKIGTAFKKTGGAFEDFNSWSAGGDSYDSADAKSAWQSLKVESFGLDNPIGYLIQCAKNENPDYKPSNIIPLKKTPAINNNIDETRKNQAIEKTDYLWNRGQPVSTHPYLTKKGVTPIGDLKTISAEDARKALGYPPKGNDGPLKGDLLIFKIGDETGEKTCQMIDGNGGKSLVAGGSKTGCWWSVQPIRDGDQVLLAEGLATAFSGYQCTGINAVVAVDASGILSVSKKLKALYPDIKILILGERDKNGDINPNHLKASDTTGALLKLPTGDYSDFNDMHQAEGKEAISEVIRAIGVVNDNQPVKRRSRFKKLSDIELKPIDWTVKNFIENDATTVIYGAPGHGKSFIAIDIACCIATGNAWHGNQVKQGSVFYIAGEGNNGIKKRFIAWEKHRGISLEDASIFPSNGGFNLVDSNEIDELIENIDSLIDETGEKLKLIIIDTLARNFIGDENSSKEVGLFFNNLDGLRVKYGCTVLVVHHSGKDGDKGPRGSSVTRCNIDSMYLVKKDADGNIKLKCEKMKDAEEPNDINFNIHTVELDTLDVDGNMISGAVIVKADETAFDYLNKKLDEATATFESAWREGKKEIIEGKVYLPRADLIQHLSKTMASGTIEQKLKPSNKRGVIGPLIKNEENDKIVPLIEEVEKGWVVLDENINNNMISKKPL